MENMEQHVDGLNAYLRQNFEVGVTFSPYEVKATDFRRDMHIYRSNEITGDWKHTHARLDALVSEYFKSIGGWAFLIGHTYVDDTKEDCGTAYHEFTLLGERVGE